jgi:general stress protein 26
MTETADTRAKVFELLKSFSTTMFVTTSTATGRTAARPMHVAHFEEITGMVWFFTSKGAALLGEIEEQPVVLLVFQNEGSAYLSLRGNARIDLDRARVKELWKEPYKVWFPGGAEDPEIALIAVSAADAEYWDNRGLNKLEYLFEAAKAYIKGEKPDVGDAAQHAKTDL